MHRLVATLARSGLLTVASLAWLHGVSASAVSDRAYERAVDLIDRLYLYPGEIDAPHLLRAAARSASDDIPWLMVDADGDAVDLSHGTGAPIGSVSVASMATLAEALQSLERLITDAGYPLDDVDVRLSLLKGITDPLDRYSRVLTGERLKRFDVRLKGTVVGVGIGVDLVDDRLVVDEVVASGPAGRAGIHTGDTVLRIDGVSTTNMPVREAIRRLRGDEVGALGLTLQRPAGEVVTFRLEREEIVVENVTHDVLEGGVGYLRIDHFSQKTIENLDAALADLTTRGALRRGLIVDLRGNTGGSMKEAARSADYFLLEGMLLRTVGPDGGRVQNLQARIDAKVDGFEPSSPVVLLVDERTASGSEILAGSLLEHGRAALVGTRTYGKGTVQKIYNLDDGARLKLTVAQYLLANDRSITGSGLVPDVVLGTVELGKDGVRLEGFRFHEAGVEWEQVVPVVREAEGWRGEAADPGDVALDLARRSVLRTSGARRRDIVEAVRATATEVRAEQGVHLADALLTQGVDWSAATRRGGLIDADVVLRAVHDPDERDTWDVIVEVENLGSEPLHRALVELECDSLAAWNGVVVPIGLIEAGERVSGVAQVHLPPGIQPREDAVRTRLRADQRPTLLVGEENLSAESTPIPRVAVEARLLGEGTRRKAELVVSNLRREALKGLEVYFEHPGELDVELIDHASRLPRIERDGKFLLELAVGPSAPAVLPLEITVATDDYERLGTWPLALPTNGDPVRIEPPKLAARDLRRAAPVGPYAFPLVVSDERRVDHVTVWVGNEKVAWAAGGTARVELRVPMDLRPGPNRVVAVAQDDQGLQTRRTWVVRGETSASVDADDTE